MQLTNIHPFPSIIRKKEWIDKQVVSSLATVYSALEDDDLFFEYIKLVGKSRMSNEQEQLANEFKNNVFNKKKMRSDMLAAMQRITSEIENDSLKEFWDKHQQKN